MMQSVFRGASRLSGRLVKQVLQQPIRLAAQTSMGASDASNLEQSYVGNIGTYQYMANTPRVSEREIASENITVNEVKIHFEKTGTGKNLVLLLPGALGSTRTDFLPQLENFNKDIFTVVAWDPRGYGKSRPPDRDWPKHFLERDANDAAQLVKELGATKCSLVGWSDGGITAMILAARYPELVNKLVVWGSNAFITDQDLTMYKAVSDISGWSERMRKPFIDLYGEKYFSEQWVKWVEAFTGYCTHSDGDICKQDLAKIEAKTLIIHGQKDAMCPEFHATYINDNIKDSRLHLMPDGKHNLHLKYFKEFNSLVENFIIEP